jgi:hypothetical protein
MNWEEQISTLEEACQLKGFFGRLRAGDYSPSEAAKVLASGITGFAG